MITGRGDTANIEAVLRTKPDLILDFGSVNGTYMSLADNTQARTGIPYALVDGRFNATPSSLRLLGRLLGAEERAEALALYTEALFTRLDALLAGIPESARPRVYLARGLRDWRRVCAAPSTRRSSSARAGATSLTATTRAEASSMCRRNKSSRGIPMSC